MIEQWNEIFRQIEKVDLRLSEFIQNESLSNLQAKKLQKYTEEWNKTKKMANAFNQLIVGVEPIDVKMPFNDEMFHSVWNNWKGYLLEQHQRLMRSRMEQESLGYLAEISDGNSALASNYLRYAMANGYRSFFKVETKDRANPARPDNNGSDF